MNQFDKIAFQVAVFSRAPTYRTKFDIRVIGISVLDLVVDACGESEELALAAGPDNFNLIQSLARQ